MVLGTGSVPSTSFFAVFDGHGGREDATYASLHMVRAGPNILLPSRSESSLALLVLGDQSAVADFSAC